MDSGGTGSSPGCPWRRGVSGGWPAPARQGENEVERPVGWALRYGAKSFFDRRRDMEDAVAVRLGFCRRRGGVHFFGVFDGHGCSHIMIWGFGKSVKVAIFLWLVFFLICGSGCGVLQGRDVRPGGGGDGGGRRGRLGRGDGEELREDGRDRCGGGQGGDRRWLHSPLCNAVESTAVVAVVSPDEIAVGNCGDSRAELCRGGKAIPLSSDHKPDRLEFHILGRRQSFGGASHAPRYRGQLFEAVCERGAGGDGDGEVGGRRVLDPG